MMMFLFMGPVSFTCSSPQGISVEGEENIQELLTKQLVLCQFICALSILRCGKLECYGIFLICTKVLLNQQ